MTTRNLLVTVTLPEVSGLPADSAENTFAFNGDDGNAGLANLCTDVAAFYNSVNGGTAFDSVAGYLSPTLSRTAGAMSTKVYVRPASAGLPYGSPIFTSTHTLGGVAGTPSAMPSECAVCLSFAADETGIPEESGAFRPRARRRGRIYLGPLNTGALGTAGTAVQRPAHSFASAALASADAQLIANAQADGYQWQVWSTMDWVGREVVTRYVDDAFDVQRRRGEAASTRWVS